MKRRGEKKKLKEKKRKKNALRPNILLTHPKSLQRDPHQLLLTALAELRSSGVSKHWAAVVDQFLARRLSSLSHAPSRAGLDYLCPVLDTPFSLLLHPVRRTPLFGWGQTSKKIDILFVWDAKPSPFAAASSQDRITHTHTHTHSERGTEIHDHAAYFSSPGLRFSERLGCSQRLVMAS